MRAGQLRPADGANPDGNRGNIRSVRALPFWSEHVDGPERRAAWVIEMIEPTPDIKRVGSPSERDYFILVGEGEEGDNISAVRYTDYNLIRIGPQHEGGPSPGGIVTGDPEDVRWFARNLLELADRMEGSVAFASTMDDSLERRALKRERRTNEKLDPTEIITRSRELCDELSKGYTRAPDETASKWRHRFASAQEGWIVRAGELVRDLADALEAKEWELFETRERKLFCRRELEALKARACDAVGMPGTTDSHSVGDRIEMMIGALKRQRDKQGERADVAERERDGLDRWMQTARKTAALAVGRIEGLHSDVRRLNKDAYRVRRALRECTNERDKARAELAKHKSKEVDLLADAYDKGRRYNEDEDDRTSEHG